MYAIRSYYVDIHLELISYKYTVFYAMALFFLLVIVIGSIPVFLFKKVSPHQMAANKMYIGKRRRLSHFFVSLQYSITIILIIITVFLFLQLKYLINKPLGFNSDNIHDVDAYNLTEGEIDVLAGKIEKWDFVENVTKTSRDFRSHYWYNTVDRGDGKQETVYMHKVDENYLSTLELNVITSYSIHYTKLYEIGLSTIPMTSVKVRFTTMALLSGLISSYNFV